MRCLIILIGIWGTLGAFGQSCNIRGRILDEHGHAIPGASISVNHTNSGTYSNAHGRFVLPINCDSSASVIIRYLGFNSIDTIVYSSASEINFILQSESEHLHELVVEEHRNSDHASVAHEEVGIEELRENDQGTLIKTLEMIPGVQSINVGVGISKPVLRGMSMNRVNVNGNGVKQEGQQWGADHGLEMDPFDAEHVEVIKGPATLKYGSGSAAGVINVLPSNIAAQDSTEGELTAIYKSNNHHIGLSGMVKTHKKDWFGKIRLSTQQFGDYRVPADSFIYNKYELPLYNNELKNTAGKEYSVSAEAGVLKKWGMTRLTASSYQLQAGIFPGAMGIPKTYDLSPDGDSRNIALPNQNIKHHKAVSTTNFYSKSGKTEYEVLLAWQQNIRQELSEPHIHGNTATGTEALTLNLNTLNANFQFEQQLSGILRQEAGLQGQYQRNSIGGFEFLIPAYQSMDLAGFYLLNYAASTELDWNVGFRGGLFSMETEKAELFGTPDSNMNGSTVRVAALSRIFWNWSIALGLKKAWSKTHITKINWNKSYRNPSVAELASNGVHHGTFRHEKGSSNLNQEQGYHADVNHVIKSEKVRLDLSGFGSYYQDFIYLKPTGIFSNLPEGGQLFEYSQDDAVFFGGELQTEFQILKSFRFKLGADYVFNQNLETQLPLPFTPPGRLLTELRYVLGSENILEKLEVFVGHRYVWVQNRVDRNELATPGYQLFHFGVSAHIKLKSNYEVRLRCTLQNALNTTYYNHLSRYRYLNLPEQGRNLVFGLDIPIGF